MKIISGKCFGRSRRSGLLATVTALAILGAGPSAFGGSGLNGGATDVGVNASEEASPYTHTEDITLESSGDDTGALTDVSFEAIGLGSENDVDIENEGAVSVTAEGGTAAEGADVDTQVFATGIETLGGVTNSGAITVTATSTDATAQGGEDAFAYSGTDDDLDEDEMFDADSSNGIYAEGEVVNSGSITVTTASGNASATADQNADAYSANYATGVRTYAADISNSGDMTISVTAGNASASSGDNAEADSEAAAAAIVSIYDSYDGTVEDASTNVTNTGALTVNATSGDASATIDGDSADDADADSVAQAVGIMTSGYYDYAPTAAPVSNVENSGDISVSATSGKATVDNSTTDSWYPNAFSSAVAMGIGSYSSNDGATETGASGNITNSGDITATATAENATATGTDIWADSEAGVLGIYTYADGFSDADGSETIAVVNNSGDITLNAAAGNADATGSEDADAYSDIEGVGIYAYGYSIGADDTVESDADTEDVYGNVDNTGNITLNIATGATTATGKDDADAYSCAKAKGIYAIGNGTTDIYGADAFGNVANSGDITLNASTADADASAAYDSEAPESYINADTEADTYATGINAYGSVYSYSEEAIDAEADGVDTYGTVTNDGAVSITATAGNLTADATAEDTASANAEIQADTMAYGITASGYDGSETDAYGTDTLGAVTNSGDISVAATGGDLDAGATAADGTAYAYARSYTTATGINAGGDAENTGGITVSATGGAVTAETETDNSSNAYATSSAAALGLGYGGSSDFGPTSADVAPLVGAYSYGGGDITNSGAVTVGASAADAAATGDDATATISASATGIGNLASGITMYTALPSSTGTVGDVDNSGDIAVTTSAGNATAGGDTAGGDTACAQTTAMTMGIAPGQSSKTYEDLSEDDSDTESDVGDVKNSGVITVAGASGNATADGEVAYATTTAAATGIGSIESNSAGYEMLGTESDDTDTASGNGSVENSGAITVAGASGNATADGEEAYAIATAAATGIGSIKKTASGILGITSDDTGPVDNNGAVSVSAAAGNATATGGTFMAAASSANASGIYTAGNITNSGDITVAATAGNAAATVTGETEASAMAYARAQAVGIATKEGTVNNSGNIAVAATAGSAVYTDTGAVDESSTGGIPENSVLAVGIGGTYESDVVNSGDITVTAAAESDEAYAFGIFMQNGGSLTNTGIIRAAGDRAYEVAVLTGALTLKDAYNMTLDADPTVGSICTAGDAVIDINDAVLALSTTEDTKWETEYKIFEVETEDGSVTGAFSGLADIDNPNIVAAYNNQGTDGSADDAVSVAYVPLEGGSAPMEGVGMMLETARTAFGLVNQRLSAVYLDSLLADAGSYSGLRLYADAGTVASDAALWGVSGSDASVSGFSLTPYYATIEKDDDPVGYDGDIMGFVINYDRQVTDKLFGLHLGYGQGDIDYTGAAASGNTEDQDFFTAGVHGMMALGKWTLRGQVAGFMGTHEYKGATGFDLELTETADYDTNGFGATIMGGYPLSYGEHMLLPEAGLEYLWSDTDGFTTDSGNEMWNITTDALSEDQVTATASLRWLTHKQVGGMTMIPSASAGIRHLLTDEVTAVHQTIGGSSPFTVEAVQNKTSGAASASLKLGKENFSGELAYLGEFGDETTLHEIWLKLNYNF